MAATIHLGTCSMRLKFDGAKQQLNRKYLSGRPHPAVCAAEMKALDASDHKPKYFDCSKLQVVLRDPTGTIGPHLPKDRPLTSGLLLQYRLWLVMFNKLKATDGNLEGDDLKISAEDFSQMERSLMQSSAPYDPPEEVDTTKAHPNPRSPFPQAPPLALPLRLGRVLRAGRASKQ